MTMVSYFSGTTVTDLVQIISVQIRLSTTFPRKINGFVFIAFHVYTRGNNQEERNILTAYRFCFFGNLQNGDREFLPSQNSECNLELQT